MIKAKEYSLREKKHARTKLAIMDSFMERLKNTRFDDISVREMCRDVEVAEGTFFNYFPEKIDVIRYYLTLNTLRMIWGARKKAPAGEYLSLVNHAFSQMSERWNNNNLTYQVISVLLAQGERPKRIDISDIEKKLAYPDCPGIEEIPTVMLHDWFKECIISARKNGELPSNVNIDDVVVSLITIVAGTILAVRFNGRNNCSYHYARQLRALWRGLEARAYIKE